MIAGRFFIMVNYINQHIAALEVLSGSKAAKPHHISLYQALFFMWNRSGWKKDLSVSREELMFISKIGSRGTYIKTLRELEKMGLIKYKPSHNPMMGSIINLSIFGPTARPTSEPTTGPSCGPLYKPTNNETSKLIKEREGEQVATPPQSQIDLDLKQPNEAKEKKAAPKKRKVFQPPTEGEVEAYCKENGYRVSAVRFVSFYQSKNWHVGKNKMTDWKSACRNWDLRDRQEAKSKDVAPVGHHIEGRRNYSLDDFYGTQNKK